MTETLLTIEQVAERLTCSRRTVERLLSEGALPVVRVRRSPRVAASDVQAYLEADKARHSPPTTAIP